MLWTSACVQDLNENLCIGRYSKNFTLKLEMKKNYAKKIGPVNIAYNILLDFTNLKFEE
jgi:hypothetical protein